MAEATNETLRASAPLGLAAHALEVREVTDRALVTIALSGDAVRERLEGAFGIALPAMGRSAVTATGDPAKTVSTGTTGYLRMQGNQVFRHAVEKLASTATTAMARAGVTGDQVDWIVPHQANIRIIQGTAKKLNLPMDRVVVTVQDHGNTSAASIPLAMSVGQARGQIKRGDLVVTEAIGGGLAWGAVVLRW